MPAYRVVLTPAAARQFNKLTSTVKEAVAASFVALADHPRPPGCIKLAGTLDLWRLRVGSHRVIYRILDAVLLVTVVTIGDRKDVYR